MKLGLASSASYGLLEPLRTLTQPLPLAALRELPVFADSAVLRQPRLSVVRLSEVQAAALASLAH